MKDNKNTRKSEKIYQGITRINDEIIEEAENTKPPAHTGRSPRQKKRPLWQTGGLAAACLCIVAAGTALLLRMPEQQDSEGGPEDYGRITAQFSSPSPEAAKESMTDAQDSSFITLAEMSVRPMLLSQTSAAQALDIPAPDTAPYTVEPDLSNVTNLDQFYLSDGQKALLAQNTFYVDDGGQNEFFEIYEYNRYAMIPNFVTVDSLMHTYHLYFSYLLRNTERNYLSDNLAALSAAMLDASITQYEQLKESEWEEAARRNVAFFTVGSCLLDETTAIKDYVADTVRYELDGINSADSIAISSITGDFEDYTQYIPRGYYEGDPALEQYFKAMMWYGRIHFRQENESLDKSALLITMALASDAEAYRTWKAIYAVTSFFSGASDDLGVGEYAQALREAYGEDASLEDLPGNSAAFDTFHTLTGSLPAPAVNSIPIDDGENNVIPGFRFMGQRFTIDAAVMQKLVYSSVGKNSEGSRRMLPDVLDAAAALGSDTALEILAEGGVMDYENYPENMETLRKDLSAENDLLWSASLYAGWLNTLRPLLEVKGEGYPTFMQSREWTKKNLECFAGSFTELKHDTILYSKQVVAEMGGAWDEEIDDRGYVEPEPLVYARFSSLAERTAQGLKEYGLLSPQDEENLSLLAQMAAQLYTISNKELQDESLTDSEYDFIRGYGGSIEHFWYQAAKETADSEWMDSAECPAPVVADIATNPDAGQVLEIATGKPSDILVVVNVDGVLKIARGSVYSFYQFTWPAEDRLTDSKWRQMTGSQADEDGNYIYRNPIERPTWTDSYRYEYEWE